MRAGAFVFAVTALVLAGCGGGSNSGTMTPPPPVAPTVTVTTPSSGATGVSVTSAIAATFSVPMNASTITSSTFTLTGPGRAVGGTVTYSASTNSATFTPNANLSYSTQYTATVTIGVMNTSGTALAANDAWLFTTAAAPAPTINAVTPANNATGVAVTSALTAAFSVSMNTSTITSSTFTLAVQGGSAVGGTVTYNSSNSTATLTPSVPLAYNTTYTATITTGVQSSLGTALAANYTWTFATGPAPTPMVTALSPTSGASGVAVASTVTATFNQAMNASTITASTFTLMAQGGTAVAGNVSYNAVTFIATFAPSFNLAYGTTYEAIITTGATSSGARHWPSITRGALLRKRRRSRPSRQPFLPTALLA
jgi:hypothetical protein